MLFVAVGTGIAGGYVVDGRVDPGAHGAAGEIGHIIVRTGADARPCGCGARGCLEAHASASAVGRAWHDSQSAQTPDNQTPNQTPSHTAKDVAAAVEAGHPSAVRIWREAVDALADGLLTAIALYDPELIVLGGGLAEAGDTLLTPLRTALTRKATFHRLPTLVRASLGDEAGCLGAALLAWEGVA
jgi:glucokinase